LYAIVRKGLCLHLFLPDFPKRSFELQPSNVFLMSNFKGWILEALALESAGAVNAHINIQYIPASRRDIRSIKSFKSRFFPKVTGNNMFFHHRTFLEVERRVSIHESRNRIWLTHFDDDAQIQELVNREPLISRLYVQNTSLKDTILHKGFPEDKLYLTPGAIDRNNFFPNLVESDRYRYFLISGDCKPRKNPFYVEWIIRSFPEYMFVIHGKGWSSFNQGSLSNLANVEFIDFQFSNQGSLLRGALALISVAHNEGGPISVLEALACGTPVISTNTGFAKDLITDQNGFLISDDLSVQGWRERFVEVIKMKRDVQLLDLLEGKFTSEKLGVDLYL
jgi:glycosyltransferase involved in cell wall biosynthesis